MKNWKSFGNMKPVVVVVVVPTWSMQVHNPINNVPEMKISGKIQTCFVFLSQGF